MDGQRAAAPNTDMRIIFASRTGPVIITRMCGGEDSDLTLKVATLTNFHSFRQLKIEEFPIIQIL